MLREFNDEYLRSGFFGAEDALISTTGLIMGVATSTQNKEFIIIASLIAISVAALSAATSELISEETIVLKERKNKDNSYPDALIMFISYFVSGFIPLIPIMVLKLPTSLIGAALASILGFIIIGLLRGELTHTSLRKSILQVLIIGAIAAGVGGIVGLYLKI